jgi:hypothetical protein
MGERVAIGACVTVMSEPGAGSVVANIISFLGLVLLLLRDISLVNGFLLSLAVCLCLCVS